MAKLQLAVDSKEVDDAVRAFNKLSAAEKKAAKEAAGLREGVKKTGRVGKSATDKMLTSAKSLIAGYIGLQGVMKGLAFISEDLRNKFAAFRKEQELALQGNRDLGAALATFRNNNRATIEIDEALVRRTRDFAVNQGKFLGAGGAARVVGAVTDVRSRIGSNATEQEINEAVRLSIKTFGQDPKSDVGQIATAVLTLQKAQGISATGALNQVFQFAEFAGGDVNAFVKTFGKLAGITKGARGVKAPITDILAVQGVLSQQLQIGPEEATTLTSNLFKRLAGGQLELGGRRVQFKATDIAGQLFEVVERIFAGEFGKSDKAFRELGIEGAFAATAPGAIQAARGQFGKAITGIRAAGQRQEIFGRGGLTREEIVQRQEVTTTGALDISGFRDKGAKALAKILVDALGTFRAQRPEQFAGIAEQKGFEQLTEAFTRGLISAQTFVAKAQDPLEGFTEKIEPFFDFVGDISEIFGEKRIVSRVGRRAPGEAPLEAEEIIQLLQSLRTQVTQQEPSGFSIEGIIQGTREGIEKGIGTVFELLTKPQSQEADQ